jgi:hypothetical protein
MRRLVFRSILALLAFAGVASAQGPAISLMDATPSAEFGAAITMQSPRDVNAQRQCDYYSLRCCSGKEFGDVGWSLSSAYSFTEKLGLVGEVAGFENSWLETGHSHESVNHVHSLMGGPRATSRFTHAPSLNSDDTRMFVQIVAGVQVSDLTAATLAVRPGAGLDILTRSGLIVRLGLDYTFTSTERRDLSGSRFVAGLVVAVPSK